MLLFASTLRRLARILCVTLVVTCVLSSERAKAQSNDAEPAVESVADKTTTDADATTDESPAGKQRPAVRLGPDTFLLPDAEGNLQPVLNLTYDQLLAALERQGTNNPPPAVSVPRYVIEKLVMTGRIEENHVALSCEYLIRMQTDELTDVGLGFLRTPLTEGPEISGKLHGMRYDATMGGYVASCKAEADSTVRLVIEFLLPLRQTENGTTFRTNVPRALSSNMELAAKSRLEQVEASDGVVVTTKIEGGATRIEAVGPAGELQVSWRTPASASETSEAKLDVVGGVRAAIDSRGIHAETKLLLQSYGSGFRQFKVRLPRNATLVRYEGTLIESMRRDDVGEEGGGSSEGEAWRVDMTEETEGPVLLTIVTEQPLGLSLDDVDAVIELSGIEVIGAVRQLGEVALLVDENWQLRPDSSSGVRQIGIDQLDADLAQGNVVVALEYFRQPWSARVRLLRRDLRVVATPQFRMEIDPDEHPDQVRLRVSVDYSISGGAVAPILFHANGWSPTADQVTSSGLANADWIEVFSDDTFGLPSARLISPPFQVSFWVARDLTASELAGIRPLKLELPSLLDTAGLMVSTSSLTVEASDKLDLVPNAEKMPGLIPQPRELDATTTNEQLSTQRFEYRGIQPELTFVATMRPRARRTTVSELVQLRIGDDLVDVVQWFDFDVHYQPVDAIELELPPNWNSQLEPLVELHVAGDGTRETLPNERGLSLDVTQVNTTFPPGRGTSRLKASLAPAQLGKFRLRVSYSMPRTLLTDGSRSPRIDVRLLSPTSGQQSGQRVAITAADGQPWTIAARTNGNDSWTPIASSDSASGGELFFATQPQTQLTLAIADGKILTPGETFVDRQWVQSWIASTVRQQRVAFQIRSSETSLRVELPRQVLADQVESLLDHVVVENQSSNDGVLEVLLPPSEALAIHTLELRYRQSVDTTAWGPLRVELPRVAGDDSRVDTYWQVIVPAHCALIDRQDGLIDAGGWELDWLSWRPVPALNTMQLEEWCGARPRVLPGSDEASYLFTTLGDLPVLEATVATRSVLVALAASGVLLVLLALLYLPAVRHPRFLLSAILILGVVGLAYPYWAILLGHAVLLGSVLGLLGWLLRVALWRSEPSPPMIRTGGSSLVVRPSGDSYPPLSLGSVVSSNAPTVSMPGGE